MHFLAVLPHIYSELLYIRFIAYEQKHSFKKSYRKSAFVHTLLYYEYFDYKRKVLYTSWNPQFGTIFYF